MMRARQTGQPLHPAQIELRLPKFRSVPPGAINYRSERLGGCGRHLSIVMEYIVQVLPQLFGFPPFFDTPARPGAT